MDDDGGLVGILTRTGALRSTIYRPALDHLDRLKIGAAIGVNGDVAGKTKRLLEMGVESYRQRKTLLWDDVRERVHTA